MVIIAGTWEQIETFPALSFAWQSKRCVHTEPSVAPCFAVRALHRYTLYWQIYKEHFYLHKIILWPDIMLKHPAVPCYNPLGLTWTGKSETSAKINGTASGSLFQAALEDPSNSFLSSNQIPNTKKVFLSLFPFHDHLQVLSSWNLWSIFAQELNLFGLSLYCCYFKPAVSGSSYL